LRSPLFIIATFLIVHLRQTELFSLLVRLLPAVQLSVAHFGGQRIIDVITDIQTQIKICIPPILTVCFGVTLFGL
jgi:hypothetical protein